MAEPMPRWFRATIGEGIQRLVAIGLPGGPGLDSVTLTAQAWAEALWEAPIEWHENPDARRLEAAFKRAARQLERWPAPRQVLELLPPRPRPPALPGPQLSEKERRRNSRRLREALREALAPRAEAATEESTDAGRD